MRSLVSRLITGLWLQEWRDAYLLAQYHARLAADHSAFVAMAPAIYMTFEEWLHTVWEEARNRQMIASAIASRQPSFREAIRQVIDECTRPGKPQFACGRCQLHGTDAEHDLHLAQNLPDPFTGKRPRQEVTRGH